VSEAEQGEVKVLEGRMDEASAEGEACMEGAESWKGVVRAVVKVEGALRKEVGRLNGAAHDEGMRRESMSSNGSGTPARGDVGTAEEGMEGVLRQMTIAMKELDEALQHAEEKGWTLLMCAIGAEVEALREGREMLEKAFGLSQVALDGLSIGGANGNTAGNDEEKENGPAEAGKEPTQLVNISNGDEEDEPSSDLLFSRAGDD
jgi:hypothetical protein